jgi:hypothetical protein
MTEKTQNNNAINIANLSTEEIQELETDKIQEILNNFEELDIKSEISNID